MTKQAKKPTHKLYHVRNYKRGEETKGFWTLIGVAYTNSDGSLSIVASVPVVLAPGESFPLRSFDEQEKEDQAPPADGE